MLTHEQFNFTVRGKEETLKKRLSEEKKKYWYYQVKIIYSRAIRTWPESIEMSIDDKDVVRVLNSGNTKLKMQNGAIKVFYLLICLLN